MSTLSQSLAARCQADWGQRFGAEERAALTAIVRTAFIDTAACILAGRQEPATCVVRRWLGARATAAPEASLLFSDERSDSACAALVNGVAGHALDYDDVGLAGHPSVVLVPALLAEQERLGVGGFDLVQAYAKGYAVWGELQRRFSVALHGRGWHPSAVFGVVAAAAAVASLRGLDARQMADAIGIAASSAGGVIANFGSMTKPLHIGRAAQAGIEAAALAQVGLDASADALDARAGLLVALAGDLSRVDVAGPIPEAFEATLLRQRPGIKKYPVCYAVHRAADGLLDLVGRHRLTPGDVAAVEATISATTADVLRHHQPRTLTEARFSMEFAAAVAIARGRLDIAAVSEESLRDPVVQGLMQHVQTATVMTSCPLEPSFAYTDRVVIVLRDGTRLDSGPIRFARGHAELPLTDAEVQAKLFSCVASGEHPLAQQVLRSIGRALHV